MKKSSCLMIIKKSVLYSNNNVKINIEATYNIDK